MIIRSCRSSYVCTPYMSVLGVLPSSTLSIPGQSMIHLASSSSINGLHETGSH